MNNPAQVETSLEVLKDSKKLELLLSQSKVGLFGGCLVTTLVVIIFWNRTNHSYLLAWLCFYYVGSYLRYRVGNNDYLRNPQRKTINKTLVLYTILTFLCGASWGLMSVYILQGDILAYGLFIIILAEGMIAGGATLYAIYPFVFVSFAFPALLPLAVYLLLQEGSIENAHGQLVLIFLVLMTVSAMRLRKLVLKSIGYQFEKNQLLDELELERKRVSDLNTKLEKDIEQLRQRDIQLSNEKDKAENLAKNLLILSTRDGLTGIPNRRHFDEFLAKEWNRAVRSESPLSLIMIDIDHFKPYNDHYGHQKGDLCLQQIASILEEHSRREGDLAARYGGEEFALVLPETTLNNAVLNAEKIRTAIEKRAIPHDASEVSNIITVSMGVTTIKPDREIYSATLIAEADKLLYQAKREGRNKIVAAEYKINTIVRD
ncbi:MAG: diguanylate cyclase (GGDEF)-like protein [Gammaproteobacteria bacterium]|jgi:diguanylate cyclase (GGDEF)-like protein